LQKFLIDPTSKYPLHEQIKEGVRMALAFGELRPGDTLPSIRELAADLNVGAAIVRRAYEDLSDAGILDISRSRRVIVHRQMRDSRESKHTEEKICELAEKILLQVLKLGVHPQSFAVYLQHWLRQSKNNESLILFGECNHLQADQLAEDVAKAWRVPVRGMDFDSLRRAGRKELQGARHLCTIPFHYEEACEVAKKHRLKVVTVSVRWDPKMLDRIRSLKPGSRVALVFKRRDYVEYGQLFLKQIQGQFPNAEVVFGGVIMEDIEPLSEWLERREWQLVYFSNRIWEELPANVRSRPDVETPTLRIDPVSLERARLEVGILF